MGYYIDLGLESYVGLLQLTCRLILLSLLFSLPPVFLRIKRNTNVAATMIIRTGTTTAGTIFLSKKIYT